MRTFEDNINKKGIFGSKNQTSKSCVSRLWDQPYYVYVTTHVT